MKKNIEALFIKSGVTIKDAMRAITEAGRKKLPVGIALVVDADKKLIGTVTDGDIRKALVKGITIEEKVEKIMVRSPITVPDGLSVDEMIKLIRQKVKESGRIKSDKIDQVIVTDPQNRVVDVMEFYELFYKREVQYKRICVVGTGHVGLTLLVVLADLGYEVTGLDINKEHVERLNRGEVGFYEKGLEPLLKFHLREKTARFATDFKDIAADVYIICVGTPVDEKTNRPVNTALVGAAVDIGKNLKSNDVVILRSTVAVGTTRKVILPILEKESGLKAGRDFYLAFAPERVVEGNALEEIKNIPQVIGGVNKQSVQEASKILQTISPSVVTLDSLEEAELVKLVNNTYRDHSFAFANQIVLLCDRLKLDAVKLIKAATEGYPRNPVPLPSPGVGGYCLTKDPHLMAEVARDHGISPDLFTQSRAINNAMPEFVSVKVQEFIEKQLKKEKKLKIYCLGFAFKGYPETSDMRGSPAVDTVRSLQKSLKGRVQLCGFDVVVKKEKIEGLGVEYLPYKEGFKNAHCVLIMNNHPDFGKLDIFALLDTMKKPGFFFDGWHFFYPEEIRKVEGIMYHGLGGF